MTASDIAVRCDNLVHVYGTVGAEVAALRGVDFSVREGETVALLGPSGAGKTTLLWHLAGLLRPTAGSVEIAGRSLATLTSSELAELRLREIGVVLQTLAITVQTRLVHGATADGAEAQAAAELDMAFAMLGQGLSAYR